MICGVCRFRKKPRLHLWELPRHTFADGLNSTLALVCDGCSKATAFFTSGISGSTAPDFIVNKKLPTLLGPKVKFVIVFSTPQIVYKVANCPRGNLPYNQITSIVLPYSQSTNYLVGAYLLSTLYPDHLYSATLYLVTL